MTSPRLAWAVRLVRLHEYAKSGEWQLTAPWRARPPQRRSPLRPASFALVRRPHALGSPARCLRCRLFRPSEGWPRAPGPERPAPGSRRHPQTPTEPFRSGPLRLGSRYVEDSLPRGLLRRPQPVQVRRRRGGPRGPGGAWGQHGRGRVRAWDRDRGEGVGQRGLRPAQGGVGEKHLEPWGTGVNAESGSGS